LVTHSNMAEEAFNLTDRGARLLWGVVYELKRSPDGSLREVSPYHYHTKREYLIIGISGAMRILVEDKVHAVRPHDLLMIRAGERHMEVDVGKTDFKVLMTGYDPPGEERVIVPPEEIPHEVRPIVDAQPIRAPVSPRPTASR